MTAAKWDHLVRMKHLRDTRLQGALVGHLGKPGQMHKDPSLSVVSESGSTAGAWSRSPMEDIPLLPPSQEAKGHSLVKSERR
jgi:hypothetical protein